MANPKEEYMQIAKRALRYLRGTLDFDLFYRKRSASKLLAYTDTDYARDIDDRKSTSGYVFLLSEAAVCWSSKKQAIITSSSTAIEYVAEKSCACPCVWMIWILEQIGDKNYECIDILCDNSSSIKLSINLVMHRRTKHIDVRYHYLRDLSNQGVVKLVFYGT
ncbi:secreted RxLR effector protein 161-like [Lathyrus oleraceus]|uniref:secreted RxLR effector protein 161-like n=1 Tax=Pisum sativum TaxID=3888 RepID=UPI0021CEE173|nr:secreted RxLR effector protein 161-like [Pisum sativum]